jgi:hypothetical protein
MNIDLKKPLKELDGNLVVGPNGEVILLSTLLAGVIGNSKTEDVDFFFKIGKELSTNGNIELTEGEYDKLEKFVRASQLVTTVSGYILGEMSSQRFLQNSTKET